MFARWLVLSLFMAHLAHAEIFKWTDEQGHVHYGNQVPEKYQRNSKPTHLNVAPPSTPAQPRYTPNAAELPKAQRKPGVIPAPPPLAASKGESPCEIAQRKYRESDACFAPYRNATGGIKPEAFEHCTEMKEPPPC